MASKQAVVQQLEETPGRSQHLSRTDMDLTDGTAGERSLVASYKASIPLAVLEDAAARLMFVTAEEFTTDGTTGNTETFSLAHNAVETKNTQNFVLYEDGARVQPDAVDYAADSFDYTDDEASSTLHAFYVARDPGAVTIEKVAPKAGSQVSEQIGEDTTSGLADRDQNKEPVEFDFMGPLEGVVPTNWKLNIYVDSPAAVRWDDSNLTTTNDDEATNAIVDLPIYQFRSNVPGLEKAVKRAALGLDRE